MSLLSKPYFHDEKAAFEKLESIVWPRGPVCPHCGNSDRIYVLNTARMGLKKCGECRKQFTVRVGTVFEASKVPLHKWMQATYLMVSSKKGISAHQLHRILEVTYKTAWFMAHRLREAMREGRLLPPLGGKGKNVEADETYIGKKDSRRGMGGKRQGGAYKVPVLALVERGGKVRSFAMDAANKRNVGELVRRNILNETTLQTDESNLYVEVGQRFARHETVKHSDGEYVRGDAYTNTVENYFSVFKRGMKGVYQHCAEKHLHRYLAEFDFRYNARTVSDVERAENALAGIVGKRLKYRGGVDFRAA
ncbi:IS1595 family transposase [Euryhalocaulis caribicus]|uniref:IS1595 family transposase n=1 Tax=Euryhalocaulis caribicus TaxID=1161401 RepID=UPI0003AB0359|nr:IS1595 family transposase [Euryhalocaulis caribicus]